MRREAGRATLSCPIEDPNLRNWIAISIGFALLLGGTAQGQTTKDRYPSRPVRIIVPFAAGGPGDIFARLIGQKLSEQLGQQFFIENRPGASGNIGTAVAARAPADGYTLMVGSSAVWINASLYSQIPYDPVKDFEPIIIGATSPEVLVVHPSVPAQSVQELVTLVRAGRYTNFAIAGVGTPPHLSTELFKLSLKLDIVMVPFGGGGPMVQSVVAGHTPVAFSTLPAASGQIKDGLPRAEEVCRLVAYADSAKVTANLWGERWSKLVTNAMANGIAACTGQTSSEVLHNDALRHFSTRVGSEAIRVGQALGYQLEEIYHLPPEMIARAGEGDEAAMRTCDEERFKQSKRTAAEQRPSMGQDMQKGRRTEIEFLNGLVVREGEKVGLTCQANAILTDIVKRVERGELRPNPRHITQLRLN